MNSVRDAAREEACTKKSSRQRQFRNELDLKNLSESELETHEKELTGRDEPVKGQTLTSRDWKHQGEEIVSSPDKQREKHEWSMGKKKLKEFAKNKKSMNK